MGQQPVVGQDLLIVEASRSHSDKPLVGSFEWMTGPTKRTLPDNTQHSQEISVPPAGSEPAVLASERPKTHALDREATGIGPPWSYKLIVYIQNLHSYSLLKLYVQRGCSGQCKQ